MAKKEKTVVDQAFVLTVVGTGMGILIGLGALTVTIWIRVDQQIAAIKEDGRIFREKWADESKDFHGRLEKQDAEFKGFMKQQEEKRTQILMGK